MTRVWVTTDGRRIPYDRLTDEHLINILNLIERKPNGLGNVGFNTDGKNLDGTPSRDLDLYFDLRAEAQGRNIHWRDWRGRPLQEGDFRHMGFDPRRLRRYQRSNPFDPSGQDSWESPHMPPGSCPPPEPKLYDLSELKPGDVFVRSTGERHYALLEPYGVMSDLLRKWRRLPAVVLRTGALCMMNPEQRVYKIDKKLDNI